MAENNPNGEKKPPLNNYARWSALAIEMGAIIGLSAWGGSALDDRFQNETPWWTIGLCLLGIFVALYLVYRQVREQN